MTIHPVVRTTQVRCSPETAFTLFTSRMAAWWPKNKATGEAPFHTIVAEPHDGGRWFERDAAGVETPWGKVLEWRPPERLLLGWQLDSKFKYDPDFMTEVELTFVPAPTGGCVVTLEHRNLERFGAEADRIAGLVGGGWGEILDSFGVAANLET